MFQKVIQMTESRKSALIILRLVRLPFAICLLTLLYFFLENLFLFVTNTFAWTDVKLPTGLFFFSLLSPYFLFGIVFIILRWMSWLYALIRGLEEKDLFVCGYATPFLLGSMIYVLVLWPLQALIQNLGLNSFGNTLFFVVSGPFALGIILLFLLAFVHQRFSRYFKQADFNDQWLLHTSVLAVFITALLNTLAVMLELLDDTVLCSLVNEFYFTFLGAAIFFKGSELICRRFIPDNNSPSHYIFLFPTLWVGTILFYIKLLQGMDGLCYDWWGSYY